MCTILMEEDAREGVEQPVDQMITPQGEVRFYAPATPALIDKLTIDPGIGAFWHYRDGYRQKELLHNVAAADEGYVTIAVAGDEVIGFMLLCPPGPGERWHGVPGVFELSIEVSRDYRRLGIAHRVMAVNFADRVWDGRIAVSQGYNWHWDTERAGLTLWQYREMFRRLHEAHGFAVYGTDDVEICYAEANVLMARVGEACSPSLRRAFFEDLYRGKWRPAWLEALLAAT